jgi:hypothetical protein
MDLGIISVARSKLQHFPNPAYEVGVDSLRSQPSDYSTSKL